MFTTESEHWNAAAAEARAGKLAAEAVNESMSLAEAEFLLACVQDGAHDWPGLVEDAFNDAVWPDDDLHEVWLDMTGQAVWKVYRAYRALGTKAAA